MLNSKSIEGYSPLMVAILYDSKDFLQTLLEYGGVDIFLINNNRLTAYQLAVSNKN
jgi:ankyrin repeat protein